MMLLGWGGHAYASHPKQSIRPITKPIDFQLINTAGTAVNYKSQ
jgi:hypothetical protein